MKIEVINTQYPTEVPNGSIMTVAADLGDGDVEATLDGGDGFEWFMRNGTYRVIDDTNALNIEPGKYYRTRNGEKVGPMEKSESGDTGGFWANCSGLYRKDGTFGFGGTYCKERDIIAEWVDERDPELTSPYGDGNHPLPPTTGTQKTWVEMTDAEKGALLLAHHEGKVIELDWGFGWHQWDEETPFSETHQAIRIKPEPKRETMEFMMYHNGGAPHVALYMSNPTHRITFTTTGGEPDLDSIKMERV